MTKKQRKHLANIIGICWILSFLGGCQQDTAPIQPASPDVIETTPTTQSTSKEPTTTVSETAPQQKQVTINPWCIGCGRCARIATDTFAMQGRQVTVISQKNANSSAVQQAASSCPAQVIEIIEA